MRFSPLLVCFVLSCSSEDDGDRPPATLDDAQSCLEPETLDAVDSVVDFDGMAQEPDATHLALSATGFSGPTCERPAACATPPCDCPMGCSGGWCQFSGAAASAHNLSCALMEGQPLCWDIRYAGPGAATQGQFRPELPEDERWVQLVLNTSADFTEDPCGLREDGVSTCPGAGEELYSQVVGDGEDLTCGIRRVDRGVECFGPDASAVDDLPGGYIHLSPIGHGYDIVRVCGVRTDGELTCVGHGGQPSLAGPFTQVATVPYRYRRVDPEYPIEEATTCGLRLDGTIACDVIDAPLGTYTELHLSFLSDSPVRLCAISIDGDASCWYDGEHIAELDARFVSMAPSSYAAVGMADDGTVRSSYEDDPWDAPAPYDGAGDNCPTTSNVGQEDMDGDGIGDACDDSDGDILPDSRDNCPDLKNQGQEDCDRDGVGDACSPYGDTDDDGVLDECDNCPFTPNADQANSESAGCLAGAELCDEYFCVVSAAEGATCDEICPPSDNPDFCPTPLFSDGACGEGDGVFDSGSCGDPAPETAEWLYCMCDPAEDRWGDACDNCPLLANDDQADADCDSVGDACGQ